MTKNCHKVVRKYLTRNVKFMNIIPGCNTKVEGQKVVNKNWLMLCKWPEEATVRVWPNMSLQRAQAGMFVFPVFKCEFSSMNTAKYSWHKQQKLLTNIHMSCRAHSRHYKLKCHVTFLHKECTFRKIFCSYPTVWPQASAINTNICDKGGLHNVNTIMFKHEDCNWWCGILFGSGLFVASPNIIFIILSSRNNMINRLLRWWINPF